MSRAAQDAVKFRFVSYSWGLPLRFLFFFFLQLVYLENDLAIAGPLAHIRKTGKSQARAFDVRQYEGQPLGSASQNAEKEQVE